MRVSRGIAVLSVATVAVLGLSACASTAEEKPDRAAAGQSAPAAEGAVEPEVDFDLTAADFVPRLTAAGQAAGSLRMEMATTTAGTTETMSGALRYADGAQEFAMTGEIPDLGTLDMRMVDGIVYMSMGALTEGKFLQIDPSDPSNPFGDSFAAMQEGFDPTGTLDGLEDAILSVEKAGEPEEVGGALAQPYTVVVDSTVITGEMAESLAALGTTLPPQLTYSYWVDADDQMRRVSADVLGVTTVSTFSAWGEPVEIAVPPADQITTELPF